jgi:Mn2+/Fe2+ NRAMP family transporter
VVFHELGARLGLVTGSGLVTLVRSSYGTGPAFAVTGTLLVANLGTTAAEFAGVAAGLDLAGVSRFVSVPAAAILVGVVVLRGSFHRIEHLLLLLSAAFVAYVAAGVLAHPDWHATGRGLVLPDLGFARGELIMAAGTVGTTLAPWGLAFIQSYVADKRLTSRDLRLERIDVVSGAVLTGVIGAFVVVACAATLFARGHHEIDDARDAAVALEPVAGRLAATLFGFGLVGAALLAAAVVPLSTAYSVSEAFGRDAALDDRIGEAPVFYGSYVALLGAGAGIVLIPHAPLLEILFFTQVANAALLLPLLVAMRSLGRREEILGPYRNGRTADALTVGALLLVACAVAGLAVAPFL